MKRFNKKEVDAMRNKYLAGKRISDLANEYAADWATVSHIVKNTSHIDETYTPKVPRPKMDLDLCLKMRLEGHSYAAIAAKAKYSPENVRRAIRRATWGIF